jgi:hypothetical protein
MDAASEGWKNDQICVLMCTAAALRCCAIWPWPLSPAQRISARTHVDARDGSIAVTHTDTSRLASICHDFTHAVSPLHALAVSPGDTGLCAAAWLDRLVVFGAPWRAAQGQRAPVVAEYRCPEVSQGVLMMVAQSFGRRSPQTHAKIYFM